MSSDDSSEDEDFSRFKDVVDTSFMKSISKTTAILPSSEEPKLHSQRYLDSSSHYNDIKVPNKLQNQIALKISAILSNTLEYVDVCDENPKKHKIKGGIKLFSDSEGLLTCEETVDNYTENHNNESKKIKLKARKRQLDHQLETLSENAYRSGNLVQLKRLHINLHIEKQHSVVVSGEHILSKEEIKHWKSRRKEKVYKYKAKGKNKVLIAVD